MIFHVGKDQKPGSLFVALQRSEFDRAAKLDRWQLGIQVLIAVLSAVSQLLPNNGLAATAAILLAAGVVLTFWLIHRSRERRSLGEQARRATLLVEGLGLRLSAADLRRFAALAEDKPEELAKWADPEYYDAVGPPSVEKAAAMLEESAFWSTHLFRASATRMQIWLVVSGIAALLCLLLALSLFPGVSSPIPIRVFSTLASSLIFFEALGRSIQYRSAAGQAADILERLARIRQAGYPKDDFFLALVDYNSAVENAPMMAPGVYAANCDRLNRIWKEYRP
jgi:hypothetical protein